MNVTLKSNWFGRPYKAYAHHYIGMQIAPSVADNYEFRRDIYNDGSWTDWQDLVEFGNKDGYLSILTFSTKTWLLKFATKRHRKHGTAECLN